jgi:transcriptional regulator with XRE-family HTH domain
VDLRVLARARFYATSGRGRIIREASYLSGNETARSIGVADSTLSLWERGLRLPRGPAAERWVDLLGELDRDIESRSLERSLEGTP